MFARRIRVTAGTREEAVVAAARVLNEGGVAFLPAEGVYGLHVRADLPDATDRLRSLKPRDPGRGIIALIAMPAELDRWAASPDPVARSLAAAHWPGALTLVVPAAPVVPKALLGPDATVALRCPGSELLRDIVARAASLVASTSANEPGEPPALTADHPMADRADLVLDTGPLPGTHSTVVAVRDGSMRLLRQGAVRIAGAG